MRSKQRTVNETLYKSLISLLGGMKDAVRGNAAAAPLLSKEIQNYEALIE